MQKIYQIHYLSLAVFLVLASNIFFAASTNAAEIKCVDRAPSKERITTEQLQRWSVKNPGIEFPFGQCITVTIKGQIYPDDDKKFLEISRTSPTLLGTLHIASPGGSVDAAIAIGKLVRRHLMSVEAPSWDEDGLTREGLREAGLEPFRFGPTIAPLCKEYDTDCVCISACSLIWFAGVARSGSAGLHRPTFAGPEFAASDPHAASELYQGALRRIENYLTDMEAPRKAIDEMIATDSAAVKWVHTSIFDIALEEPPSFREWINANCGSFTEDDSRLMSTNHLKQLNAASRAAILKQVRQRRLDRLLCRSKLLADRRLRSGSP